MRLRLGEDRVGLEAFRAAMRGAVAPSLAPGLREALAHRRAVVERLAAGPAPVYGLNTGLGAKVGLRLAPEEIGAFQERIIEGRAVAVGPVLPAGVGRAMTLARLASAAAGRSGMAPALVEHLAACLVAGIDPEVPGTGSIGASDLALNAHWARALVLGRGRVDESGAAEALAAAGLAPPVPGPRDGMALINHSGASVALAALALDRAGAVFRAARCALLLSYAGFGAHRGVLSPEANEARPAPGQAAVAAWLAEGLAGCADAPRRIQEALSFRVVAPVHGAAEATLARAVAIWEDEANGSSDSPAVTDAGAMLTTANFHAPALALALDGVAQAAAMVAHGAAQRIQRMMDPALSGLPRALSPEGGVAAGMVPLQKTAMALMGEIRQRALPVAFDPPPVSETVEDMAPQTPAAATKLAAQMSALRLLVATEALVAAQAVDLRGLTPGRMGPRVAALQAHLRARVPPLGPDRPLGPEVEAVAALLDDLPGALAQPE